MSKGYPYEFKPEDARRFASFTGIRTVERGDELFFKSCPICNGSGKGNEKTFSINLKTGQYKCFRAGCGAKGNMITLARDFDFKLDSGFEEYYRPRKRYKPFPKPKEPIIPKPAAIQYLESRGISKQTAERYEITTKTEQDNILVFPFFDEKGDLVFIKYRKTDFNKETDNDKEWAQPNGKTILFGIKQCYTGTGTVIITEGQLDSLSVAEAGYNNAVSVPNGAKGMTWIPHCWDWMQNFQSIIVFGDHEKGHITLLDDIAQRFSHRIFHVREEDYMGCKDANEILQNYGKEQIKRCIDNAVQMPVNDVVDLADVEDVDIFAIEKLQTGIFELDRMLYGGLPFGGVHLISGKSGNGKSTFASQILINARQEGYRCFAYSGELPNYLFKAWMNFQVAGRRHIFEYQNDAYGNVHYNISQENKRLISEWYRGYMYLYDNSKIDVSETQELLKVIETVIQRYGVKVVLLDNLMTAMTMDSTGGSDQYERQTEFVNRLRSIAVKYNVIILLVAHKRKNNFSENENDEIAGSSNISNLAMLTLTYERGKDCDKNQRLLKLSKNRLFGKLETDGFVMEYDPKSKRIYGQMDDLDKEFYWNPEADGFVDADDVVFD